MDTVTILNIERQFWRTAGAKEQAITEAGWSPVRYYQRLNQLLDDPAFLQADPPLVYRLRRLRTTRRRSTPPR